MLRENDTTSRILLAVNLLCVCQGSVPAHPFSPVRILLAHCRANYTNGSADSLADLILNIMLFP